MIEELYGAFYKDLLRFCERLNNAFGEDLAQETFLRALSHQEDLLDLSTAQRRSWLFQTAKRLAIDRVRKLARETCMEPDILETADYEEDLSAIAVRQLLLRLPDMERVIFELRYFQGYNASELGEMMGVNPSTIRARLASARKHLQQQLADT